MKHLKSTYRRKNLFGFVVPEGWESIMMRGRTGNCRHDDYNCSFHLELQARSKESQLEVVKSYFFTLKTCLQWYISSTSPHLLTHFKQSHQLGTTCARTGASGDILMQTPTVVHDSRSRWRCAGRRIRSSLIYFLKNLHDLFLVQFGTLHIYIFLGFPFAN